MYGKTIAENRAARHEYFIDETVETGIVLDGGEVKSVRGGSVNLKDSFCLVAGSSRGEKGMFFDASKMSLPSPRTSMPSKPRSLAIE